MTSPDHEVVEREIHIAARPEIVFSFFTDPEKLVRWLGIRATLNAQPGGACHIHINERDLVGGQYLEVVPYSRVVFTWGWEGSLTGIGFLLLSADTCSRSSFCLLSSFFLVGRFDRLFLAGSWFLRWSHDLGPGRDVQDAYREILALKLRREQEQVSTQDTTQAARRTLSSRTSALFACDVLLRQVRSRFVLAKGFLPLGFGLASQAHTPELGECQSEPEPFNASGSLHFAVVPAPEATLKVFEAAFDPRAEPIPGNLRVLWLQIRQDDPRCFVSRLPMHQHGGKQATGFARKTLHLALPVRARCGHPSAEPLKRFAADLSRL